MITDVSNTRLMIPHIISILRIPQRIRRKNQPIIEAKYLLTLSFYYLVFDTLRIKQVPQSLINTGMVALYAVCMKYSNVLSLLTFFLNSFHFPFCYKLIVRPESTCLMKVIRYLLALIYRDKSLFFYICKFYVS